jgi:hypothetical protein
MVGLTGSDRARPPQLRVLQLNLCNSGLALCYTGRSVAQAADLIRARAPHVVTLNEVCDSDVTILGDALAEAHRDGTVMTAFQAAMNGYTGRPVGCRDGRVFGNGLLVHVSGAYRGQLRYGGIYPMQATRDEYRAWLCLDALDELYACATHLPEGAGTTALAQCAYLFSTVIPLVRTAGEASRGGRPLVIGADLNLGRVDARACGPPDYARADDGTVQHVLATPGLRPHSVQVIDMRGTTDHPALFVVFHCGDFIESCYLD